MRHAPPRANTQYLVIVPYTKVSPIESLLQYRFAPPKALKLHQASGELQNRSFVQAFPLRIPFWGLGLIRLIYPQIRRSYYL